MTITHHAPLWNHATKGLPGSKASENSYITFAASWKCSIYYNHHHTVWCPCSSASTTNSPYPFYLSQKTGIALAMLLAATLCYTTASLYNHLTSLTLVQVEFITVWEVNMCTKGTKLYICCTNHLDNCLLLHWQSHSWMGYHLELLIKQLDSIIDGQMPWSQLGCSANCCRKGTYTFENCHSHTVSAQSW